MKTQQNKDREALYRAILSLETPQECEAFFHDLCTYQELGAMTQRLRVAELLSTGHVFQEIVELTGASTATISRVNRSIKDGMDGYKLVFERLEEEKERKEDA